MGQPTLSVQEKPMQEHRADARRLQSDYRAKPVLSLLPQLLNQTSTTAFS
jgi:hypothetical protein